jgi:hypothetical protein
MNRADEFAEEVREKLVEHAGASPTETARNLNAAGVPGPQGRTGTWTARAVLNVEGRLTGLDKAAGVAALANALIFEGLDHTDWTGIHEEWEEQASRYADRNGDLRGFQFEGGGERSPELRREIKRWAEGAFARATRIQREKVEALRAAGTDPETLRRLESYMEYDALVDAGLVPDRNPLTGRFQFTKEYIDNLPPDPVEEEKRRWKEAERKLQSEARKQQWADKRARGGITRKEASRRKAEFTRRNPGTP